MSYETGKLLINHKQFKKAYYILSKLLIDKPDDFKVNFQMGKMYYELNDLNKSIFYFKKSNKLHPNNPNILFNLALVLQAMGEIKKAKQISLSALTPLSKEYEPLHNYVHDHAS